MGSDWAQLVAEASAAWAPGPSGLSPALLLPWERGFAGAVLGGGLGLNRALAPALYPDPPPPTPAPPPRVHLPVLMPPVRDTRTKKHVPTPRLAARTTFGRVRRKTKDAHPRDLDKQRRDRVIEVWVEIATGSGAGTLVDQCKGDLGEVRRSLGMMFTNKATSTLVKRAAAIRTYQRWYLTMNLPGQALPATEDVLFRYLAELFDEGAAATRGQALLEALNLACATLGLDAGAQQSARVRGAAAASFAEKRGTLQRPPLTVDALQILEDGVISACSPCARVFCGFLAFCTHARLRFLDAARISVEPTLDESGAVSFVQSESKVHKGANRPRVRGLSLPVVGHAVGVRGEPWAEAWLRLRREMNLDAAADGALMLTPSSGDSFTGRRLTTTEGAIWMREVLIDAGLSAEEAGSYGTHSLKATMLSWCAKAGMAKGTRRLLGGHAANRDRSVLEYSRDALAEPLRQLGEVLDRVALGEFFPDATRSGRWRGLTQARGVARHPDPHASTPTVAVDSSSDETGCTSESTEGKSSDRSVPENVEMEAFDGQELTGAVDMSATSSDSGTVEDADDSDDGKPKEPLPEGGLVQHVRYRTLHARSVADDAKLVCGRAMTEKYRDLQEWPVASWSRCKGCFV